SLVAGTSIVNQNERSIVQVLSSRDVGPKVILLRSWQEGIPGIEVEQIDRLVKGVQEFDAVLSPGDHGSGLIGLLPCECRCLRINIDRVHALRELCPSDRTITIAEEISARSDAANFDNQATLACAEFV